MLSSSCTSAARERRDGQPRLLRARRADDEPFLLQSLQRLAHRRAAHAESARDLRLDDAASGREQPLHDEIAQSQIHLLRSRAVRRIGRGRVVGGTRAARESRERAAGRGWGSADGHVAGGVGRSGQYIRIWMQGVQSAHAASERFGPRSRRTALRCASRPRTASPRHPPTAGHHARSSQTSDSAPARARRRRPRSSCTPAPRRGGSSPPSIVGRVTSQGAPGRRRRDRRRRSCRLAP